MQRPATETPTTTQSDSVANPFETSSLPSPSPSLNMAASTQQRTYHTLPHVNFRDQRPTLPPLANLENTVDRLGTSPLHTPPIVRGFGHWDPFQRQTLPQPSAGARNVVPDSRYQPAGMFVSQPKLEPRDAFWSSQHPTSPHDGVENPLKRSFGIMAQSPARITHPLQKPAPLTYIDPRTPHSQSNQPQFPSSTRSSYSDASTPSQAQSITSFMGQDSSLELQEQGPMARIEGKTMEQCLVFNANLRIRAIDPPPVLQLMINDFDIDDDDDMNELRSSYFVVHCRLISATQPNRDLSTTHTLNEDGTVEVQRLLLGTTVASPFFCQDDPDLERMPTHPVTTPIERPPSPTSRFIQSRRQSKGKEKGQKPQNLPGSFFIFADLSVRKAGEYRLEFCLMKIEASSMIAGKNLPIVNTVHSQVFKVVNAKDFDQVQPSTELVKGLLDRGAGFPLKLKKGIREGQRRRQTQDESDDDDDDDDEEAS